MLDLDVKKTFLDMDVGYGCQENVFGYGCWIWMSGKRFWIWMLDLDLQFFSLCAETFDTFSGEKSKSNL